MKLLIHACCADCLLKMMESIKNEREIKKMNEIEIYYYNPNIHPRSEYLARLKAFKQVAEDKKIKTVTANWSPKEWFSKMNGNFEKPNRCENCWELRLKKSFEYAAKNNFEAVSTTLLTSHYQNKNKIEEIGKSFEKEFGIKFLVPDKLSCDLKTTGFYKQNYCGCCYSLAEAWGEKFRL